jgi:hypothetical protein
VVKQAKSLKTDKQTAIIVKEKKQKTAKTHKVNSKPVKPVFFKPLEKTKISEIIILPHDELEKIDRKFEGDIKSMKSHKKELKILRDVAPHEYFVLVTGTPLKNIKELIDALDYMDNWVFEHHVNSGRNDFADWVRWSLEEQELADILHELRTMGETQNAILKYLVRRYL